MMTRVAAFVFLAAFLAPSWGQGQETGVEPKTDKAKPATLEELIKLALKQHPDVRLAEARAREAEAMVDKTRVEVSQKVALAYHQVQLHEALFKDVDVSYRRVKELFDKRLISPEEVSKAEASLLKAKAELSRVRLELSFLVGNAPGTALSVTAGGMDRDDVRLWTRTVDKDGKTSEYELVRRMFLDVLGRLPTPQELAAAPKTSAELIDWIVVRQPSPTGADKLRAILNLPIKADFSDVRLKDVVEVLQEKAKGINIHWKSKHDFDTPVRLRLLEPVPLGAMVQWFEDTYAVKFVWREYGVVIADAESVPPGAVLVMNLWKQKEPEKAKEAK